MGNWDPPNMVVCERVVSQGVSTNDAFYKLWLVHFGIILLVYVDHILTWQLLLSLVSLPLFLSSTYGLCSTASVPRLGYLYSPGVCEVM